ncbi:MAG: HIT domain-containing protein [Acidimicrobiia bacterium]|nr:HIT domain-containing protein [Acidimicrobiia bacterium]
MTECRTCELTERRDRGEAPDWDLIVRTADWDLVHAYDTSIEGWLVLVARRHVTAVADLTADEALELGPMIRWVSLALAEVTGCEKTYVVQFAEHPEHPHVHVHVIARPPDLAPELQGPGIFGALGVPEAERVSEERMDEIARAMRVAVATHR